VFTGVPVQGCSKRNCHFQNEKVRRFREDKMSEKDDFAKGMMTGALIGGLVGVVVGILIAPKSGVETRQELSEKAKDFADKVQDEYDVLYDKAKRSTDTMINRLHELEVTARKKADELAGKLKA
jgi:gas vesicle protein